ncbi:hypothetical protein C0583_04660 [Candidatus Parcubacteria bacterium]|nr:MAG: hypothetical protein C0583_04660 [Candidatus Parcubacteria bacterium]
MDIKSVVARIASDCDLRTRFNRNVPGLFDDYVLSGQGELMTKDEANRSSVFNYFLDGMDFVSSQVTKV